MSWNCCGIVVCGVVVLCFSDKALLRLNLWLPGIIPLPAWSSSFLPGGGVLIAPLGHNFGVVGLGNMCFCKARQIWGECGIINENRVRVGIGTPQRGH